MKKVAVLTGGGDSSGINALIRSIVVNATKHNLEILGIKEGWRGLLEENFQELNMENTEGINRRAGTILKTSRTNPLKEEGQVEHISEVIKKHNIDALIAIGGDDTLGVAGYLHTQGLPVVGIPQTIDNDIYGTEYCVGFNTAVNQVLTAIEAMRESNISHQKGMIVEVMGRESGWIAMYAGLIAEADYVMIPEHPLNFDHLIDSLKAKKAQGKEACLVIVSEGIEIDGVDRGEAVDAFGNKALAGISYAVAEILKQKTGWDKRIQVLGHYQRGGQPTAYELRNSIEMGQYAVQLLVEGNLGNMVARIDDQLTTVPLSEIRGKKGSISKKFEAMAKQQGIFGI